VETTIIGLHQQPKATKWKANEKKKWKIKRVEYVCCYKGWDNVWRKCVPIVVVVHLKAYVFCWFQLVGLQYEY